MNIVITITAIVLTWLVARWWYKGQLDQVNRMLSVMRERCMDHERYIAKLQHTPDILGTAVIEPGANKYGIEPEHLYIDEDDIEPIRQKTKFRYPWEENESMTSIGHRYIDDSDETAEELPDTRTPGGHQP